MSMFLCVLFMCGMESHAAEKKLVRLMKCGENAACYFYDTDADNYADLLEVNGSGDIRDYKIKPDYGQFHPEEFDIFYNIIETIKIGEGITGIGENAFADFQKLRTVILPNSLTTIRSGAFSRCESLNSIVLPDNVSSVESKAFAGCSHLAYINIPAKLEYVGDAFFNGTSVKVIYVPSNIEWVTLPRDVWFLCDEDSPLLSDEIYKSQCLANVPGQIVEYKAGANLKYTFNCKDLSLVISGSGQPYKDQEFEYASIVKSISFKDYTDEELPDLSAFNKIKSIVLPESIKRIPKHAFSMFFYLENVELPKALMSIERGAFAECQSLKKLEIPSTVNYIAENTFYNCLSLEDIVIPGHVSVIRYNTFQDCNNLKKVVLSKSVKNIEQDAFLRCKRLETAYVYSPYATIAKSVFAGKHCTVYCYSSVKKTIDDYKLPGVTTKSLCDMGEHCIIKIFAKASTDKVAGNKEYYECEGCGKCFADVQGKTVITKDSCIMRMKQTITYKKIKKYKAKNLKKKKVTFTLGAKASGKGKLTYKVVKGSKKYITVSKKGKVTLKKGCKKGKYKIQITAAQTKNYDKATKVVSIKVK